MLIARGKSKIFTTTSPSQGSGSRDRPRQAHARWPSMRRCIYLSGDRIEAVFDRIVNDGPSWSPVHYADDRIISRLSQLVQTSENTGSLDALTVAREEHLMAVRRILEGLGVKMEGHG